VETLYDLLGALRDDDAESLRAAFRKAVKGAHPDINPGDPDAALKFRQIVRANEILSDEAQRAAYDHLLDLARLEQKAASKRASAVAIYWLATSVMALAVVSTVSLGGYLLFGYVNRTSLAPTQTTDVSRAEPAKTAALKTAALVTELADTHDWTRDKLEDIDGPKKLENPRDIKESGAPDAVASVASAYSTPGNGSIPPARDLGLRDANYYRERAMSAYRNGDLYLALADLDLAISLDPGFSDAYIDRGIVFHRMGDLNRAFADVAEAKRIDISNQGKARPAAGAP
jgi:tetratricopeptide (TPR) repeat protein